MLSVLRWFNPHKWSFTHERNTSSLNGHGEIPSISTNALPQIASRSLCQYNVHILCANRSAIPSSQHLRAPSQGLLWIYRPANVIIYPFVQGSFSLGIQHQTDIFSCHVCFPAPVRFTPNRLASQHITLQRLLQIVNTSSIERRAGGPIITTVCIHLHPDTCSTWRVNVSADIQDNDTVDHWTAIWEDLILHEHRYLYKAGGRENNKDILHLKSLDVLNALPVLYYTNYQFHDRGSICLTYAGIKLQA